MKNFATSKKNTPTKENKHSLKSPTLANLMK